MGRVQPKSSTMDEYAKRTARAIAKGRPPPFGAELDRYCEDSPHEIFAAFAGAARHMPPVGKDEALAIGYLFLLQRLLEFLRYRTDRGYSDAAELIMDFQAEVVARVEAGDVDRCMLAFVGGALHHSKIPASPAFAAATARHPVDQDDVETLPPDIGTAFAGILEACDGDPFVAVGSLIESGHAVPAETRSAMAGALAFAGSPEARDAAVMFLLDPDWPVRRAAARALTQVATLLTPTQVRRLITMRNWRPENERAEVDAVIRKARGSGIDCAQWEAGSIEVVFATATDGAATQGFLLVSPVGRKIRISSILTKRGIADAWSGEPESRRRTKASLVGAGMNAPMLAVSRSYLDRAVAHQLAHSCEKGEAPPLGLLQVAEAIGGADWQPSHKVFGELLAEVIGEVPKAMWEPATVASILRKSDELADLEAVAQSWFEDDQEVSQAVQRARGRDRAKLANYLLQSIIARHRDRWAEIILRTALWMREAPPDANLRWRELAIVAKALADGWDMTEIGLMRDIALRTIAVRRPGGAEVWFG
jgi:hypothetical protein